LHDTGTLDEERYKLWEGFAISMVACKGLREWWDEERGKMGFMPEVRELFDRKLNDKNDPPIHFNQFWSIMNASSWDT
jgi:hypothetical protein